MKDHTYYLEAFSTLETAIAGAEPEWLTDLRREGARQFEALGFPHQRMEDWRYTNLKPMLEHEFGPSDVLGDDDVKALLDEARIEDFDRYLIVLVNGSMRPGLSDLEGLPGGVTLMSLNEAVEKHADVVRTYLGKQAKSSEYAFQALNTAFMTDGLFLRVAAGVELDKPVHLVHIAAPGSHAAMNSMRNLIVLEAGAKASLIKSDIGQADSVYLTNVVNELVIEKQASLRFHRIMKDSREAYNFSATSVYQEADSRLKGITVNLGGRLVRNDMFTELVGDRINSALDGLYYLDEDRQMDNFTRFRHMALEGNSRQVFKGILDGRSRGVFDGRIFVNEGAQLTDAVQTNRNLLLSDDAVANAKPQLEIYADDVKCTHGATTGKIDQDQLFYLMSRGYSEKAARATLTYAFAGELIDEIEIEPVRNRLVADLQALML